MRNLISTCGVYFARKTGASHGYKAAFHPPPDKDVEMRDICNVTLEEQERNKKIAKKIEKRKADQEETKPMSMSAFLYKKDDKEKQESQKKAKPNHRPISFDI
jgi:hypothetical protein